MEVWYVSPSKVRYSTEEVSVLNIVGNLKLYPVFSRLIRDIHLEGAFVPDCKKLLINNDAGSSGVQ